MTQRVTEEFSGVEHSSMAALEWMMSRRSDGSSCGLEMTLEELNQGDEVNDTHDCMKPRKR